MTYGIVLFFIKGRPAQIHTDAKLQSCILADKEYDQCSPKARLEGHDLYTSPSRTA